MSSWPQRTIRCYHGPLPKKVVDVLNYVACPEMDESGNPVSGAWFYDGSLDRLTERLAEVEAMCYAKNDVIFVTQHDNWNVR